MIKVFNQFLIKWSIILQIKTLLQYYYEVLYDQLSEHTAYFDNRYRDLLFREFDQHPGSVNEEKLAAYQDACAAFLLERIEMYNPIGLQYMYDRGDVQDAFKLELTLNWYDGRDEWADLVNTAREVIRETEEDTDEFLSEMAGELIRRCGAYPDQSILRDYRADPALNKLPDYVVAVLIEQFLKEAT